MADQHTNFAVSTVATAPSPATSGTSLVVASGEGSRFPAVPFNATIWPAASQPDPSNAEIVRVTARSTDTLTISRAQESSTARTVVVGDQIAATITAKTLTDAEGFVPGAYLGVLTESFDACQGGTAGATQGTGRILVTRVAWTKNAFVTNILAQISTAGATLTSGQNLAALYDSAGNLLANTTTADQSTAWTSAGAKTMAIGTAQTIPADPNGYLYVALLTVGTTPPLWTSGQGTNTNSNIFIPSNVGQRAGQLAATGLTAMPSTITLTTMTAFRIPHVALS